MSDPAAAFAGAMAALMPEGPPPRLGLAVSGGGDSTALAVLAADWARPRGVALAAVTVDHGLRPGSAAEAAAAGALCAGLGIPHAVLRWDSPAGRGNLQDRARTARQRLISGWAAAQGLAHVATGHTLDDQAETVLMRLARGSGVDGLSAIAPARRLAGVVWLRPLLGVPRAALRALLAARGIGWAEDPSNDEARFLRARARAALAALAPLGITAAGLAATAGRMARARRALECATCALADRAVRIEAGDVILDAAALAAAPEELRARLLAHALRWVSGAPYPPRAAELARLAAALAAGRGGTLAGCRASAAGGTLRIAREWQAVRGLRAAPGEVWDGRWRLTGPAPAGAEVRALGPEGLARCPGWRAAGLPRASLLASPAVWAGDALVAAPLAGLDRGWTAEALRGAADFRAGLFGD